MYCISNLHYWTTNEFAKALLIADFLTESDTSHKDNLLSEDSYLEDFA